MLDDIWDSGGYRAEVDRLAQMALVEIESADVVDYRQAADLYLRLDDRVGQARCSINMGIIYGLSNDTNEAEQPGMRIDDRRT